LDADGSTDPAEIPRYVMPLLEGADFVKGSRFMPGGATDDITPLRKLGNSALNGTVNKLYGTRYTDLCYGYNAFWNHCLPVRAVLGQSRPPEQLVLVVDHNYELERRMREAYPDTTVVANEGPQGLSQARNTGVRNSSGDVVVFLDDDACPEHEWLAELLAAYDDPDVIGAGGLVLPRWETDRPAWQPVEFDWVVGCSYRGLPESVAPIR